MNEMAPGTQQGAELGMLPEWDLRDLYPATDGPEFARDMQRAAADAKAFQTRFQGTLAGLDGPALAAAIREYEVLQELTGRLSSYAYLVYATAMNDSKVGQFYQNARERLNDVYSDLLFFTLEINRIDDAALEERLKGPDAGHFAPWIRTVRLYRDHQLSDDLEKILNDKDISGRAAWTRLFDETVAGLRVDVDGKAMTSEQALNLLADKDGETRRKAAKGLSTAFASNIRLFALVTNTLAKDKEIEDRWRGYPDPMASRHLANQVEPAVVEALVSAVNAACPRLTHRFYALKARLLGKDKLEYWDRSAPLPEDADRLYPWAEARDMVLGAYKGFSDELGGIGQRFFDNAWIDAPLKAGKASGAFAHPTVPSAHPYLLLNYQGKTRDVMTLAHELGHGVHNVLAGPQGYLMSSTPLTLAETASVFGEQLTFRALLDAERDPVRRRVMLANKTEAMINTVFRQIAFYEFEKRIHMERRGGEITAERIGEIWLEVMGASLGPAFRLDPDYSTYWCYVLHFIHVPFYVYAYAFGDCLVNSLYAVYQAKPEGFEPKYLDMLRAGGTLQHKELLAPFGLDASDPTFWDRGLGVIGGFIDELEAAYAQT